MRRTIILVATLFISCGGEMRAAAHHSFAMFDATKLLTLSGTVKEWQWTNPHSWLALTVMEAGKPTDYDLESRSIYILRMAGLTRNSFKLGDKVTVTFQPLRSGEKGGSLMSAVGEDGTPILKGRPAPDAEPKPISP